jgi:AraC-like DNA-binding protein
MKDSDLVHFERHADLDGLEIVHARYGRHVFARHTHEEYVLGVMLSGVERQWYRGAKVLLPPRDLITFNPDEPHGGEAVDDTGWEYRCFYPSANLMYAAAREAGLRELPFFPSAGASDSLVARTFIRMHETLMNSASSLEHESVLLDGLVTVIRRLADSHRPLPKIGQEHHATLHTKRLLEDQYAQNVKLVSLADEVRLSPYRLLRIFRRDVGMSPHEYQTLLRVRSAKAALQQGGAAAQVALKVGFVDQAHLIRHFKRVYGLTPGQYARAIVSQGKARALYLSSFLKQGDTKM